MGATLLFFARFQTAVIIGTDYAFPNKLCRVAFAHCILVHPRERLRSAATLLLGLKALPLRLKALLRLGFGFLLLPLGLGIPLVLLFGLTPPELTRLRVHNCG